MVAAVAGCGAAGGRAAGCAVGAGGAGLGVCGLGAAGAAGAAGGAVVAGWGARSGDWNGLWIVEVMRRFLDGCTESIAC